MEPELFREGIFSQIEFGMWKYNRTGHWQFVQNNRIWDYSSKRAFQRTFQWRHLLIVKSYLICGNRTIAKQFVQNYSHHCLLQWDLGLFKPKSLAKSLFCCKISQNNEEDRFVFFLETMFKDGSLYECCILKLYGRPHISRRKGNGSHCHPLPAASLPLKVHLNEWCLPSLAICIISILALIQ